MTAETLAPPAVLYFSRLTLAGAAAENPYEVHRRLWLAFPGMPEANRPFLFHPQWGSRPLQVVMQSTLRPQPVQWRDCRLDECRAARLDLRSGALHRFLLWANPSRRSSLTRQRHALGGDAERIEWLRVRLAPAAQLLEGRVEEVRTLRFAKGGREGVVRAVRFAGALRVLDAGALRRLVLDGIGPARSLGCGLLLLAGG